MAETEFTTEELENEEWRDIPEFGNQTANINFRYQVSNLGRARSVRVQILKPSRRSARSEYPSVSLFTRGERRGFRKSVHVAVAEAFLGPRPKGMLVNHIDTNKSNPRSKNLEYRTPKGNAQHASENGLLRVGEDNKSSKLRSAQVVEIIKRLVCGEATRRIARDYPVSDVVIGLIRQGRLWKHIPRPVSPYLGRLPYDGNPQGTDSSSAKLTAGDVRSLRDLYASGQYRMQDLGDAFGIGKSQTKRIIDCESRKIA